MYVSIPFPFPFTFCFFRAAVPWRERDLALILVGGHEAGKRLSSSFEE